MSICAVKPCGCCGKCTLANSGDGRNVDRNGRRVATRKSILRSVIWLKKCVLPCTRLPPSKVCPSACSALPARRTNCMKTCCRRRFIGALAKRWGWVKRQRVSTNTPPARCLRLAITRARPAFICWRKRVVAIICRAGIFSISRCVPCNLETCWRLRFALPKRAFRNTSTTAKA